VLLMTLVRIGERKLIKLKAEPKKMVEMPLLNLEVDAISTTIRNTLNSSPLLIVLELPSLSTMIRLKMLQKRL
jgi:hypothetical protein